MSILIPSRETKSFVQNNRSNILGTLWSTLNMDFQSRLGVMRVSPRMKVNTSSADDADLGCPVAFKFFDGRWWSICDTRVFKSSSASLLPNTSFTEDASTGVLTDFSADYSDLEIFNSELAASSISKLLTKTTGSGAGAWTERHTFTLDVVTHKLKTFKKFNRLYFTDNQTQIKSMDTSYSVATSGDYFIDLGGGSDNYITCLETTSESIFIGVASNNNSRGGKVMIWDGISGQVTSQYLINAQGVSAMVVDENQKVFVLDSNGIFLEYTGYGFREVCRLPTNNKLLTNAGGDTRNIRFVHPNGIMTTPEGTFLVLINNLNGDNTGTINENFPSGVWEIDPNTGSCSHRYSLSYNPVGVSSITDYGQNRVFRVGAIANANRSSTDSTRDGTLFVGASYYTNASSTASAIFIDNSVNTIQKYGYFVTVWIEGGNLKEIWQKCYLGYRKLLDSGDKIVMKYRTTEVDPTYISITWVNTTSFTTTTNVSSLVGYEVEVIQGTGSGKCAHITSVSGSGTYTVNLDETFTGVTTGTAKARVQAWTKFGSISDQVSESFEGPVEKTSERIQIKVCMQFTGDDEVRYLNIINKVHQPMI